MPVAGARLKLAMTRLAWILQTWVGDRPVQKAADEAGVSYWVVRDAIQKGTCPRPLDLIRLAQATGHSIEDLALAARQRNGDCPNGHGDGPKEGK